MIQKFAQELDEKKQLKLALMMELELVPMIVQESVVVKMLELELMIAQELVLVMEMEFVVE